MIYIYAHTVTTRLDYTLKVIFNHILQVDFLIVDEDTFNNANSKHPKLNYSEEKLPDAIWIKPDSLLYEDTIKKQDIAVSFKENIPYFYKTSEESDFPFDIIASSFFMLSRYEEYLPFNKDLHGRFPAKESLAYKANFIDLPVVHLWAIKLRDALLKQKPNFLFPTRIFTQLNTLDIDIAYAYKGKPFIRNFGAFFKSLFTFNFKDLHNRISVFLGKKDPYDTYDIIESIQKESTTDSIYFFQVGKYGVYDKNLRLKKMRNLIKRISKHATIGIHPSYQSNESINSLKEEKENLSNILGKPITKSRQHYLKMTIPNTYENLISIGVKEDYTMGFAQQVGFRAGMALPFPFFNLQLNKERSLLLIPFQIMDDTLKDYMQLSPVEAKEKIHSIKQIIKDVNGQLITIFHNSFLTNQDDLKGWVSVYKSIFK